MPDLQTFAFAFHDRYKSIAGRPRTISFVSPVPKPTPLLTKRFRVKLFLFVTPSLPFSRFTITSQAVPLTMSSSQISFYSKKSTKYIFQLHARAKVAPPPQTFLPPVSNPARLAHSLPPQVRPVRAQMLDNQSGSGGRRQRAEVLNERIRCSD